MGRLNIRFGNLLKEIEEWSRTLAWQSSFWLIPCSLSQHQTGPDKLPPGTILPHTEPPHRCRPSWPPCLHQGAPQVHPPPSPPTCCPCHLSLAACCPRHSPPPCLAAQSSCFSWSPPSLSPPPPPHCCHLWCSATFCDVFMEGILSGTFSLFTGKSPHFSNALGSSCPGLMDWRSSLIILENSGLASIFAVGSLSTNIVVKVWSPDCFLVESTGWNVIYFFFRLDFHILRTFVPCRVKVSSAWPDRAHLHEKRLAEAADKFLPSLHLHVSQDIHIVVNHTSNSYSHSFWQLSPLYSLGHILCTVTMMWGWTLLFQQHPSYCTAKTRGFSQMQTSKATCTVPKYSKIENWRYIYIYIYISI